MKTFSPFATLEGLAEAYETYAADAARLMETYGTAKYGQGAKEAYRHAARLLRAQLEHMPLASAEVVPFDGSRPGER